MSRERMVTRTVDTNVLTVMTVNTKTASVVNTTLAIGGVLKDEKEALKRAKALLETDELKVVAIVSHTVEQVLYGMSEMEFIKLAKVLPPRTTANANED